MKKLFVLLAASLLSIFFLTACGKKDTELIKFRSDIDAFCTRLSDIDRSINSIDADSDEAVPQLFQYLDELDLAFQGFAKMDFPAEFDYLEPTASEASQYMTTAVEKYREAFGGESYNKGMAEYAEQNYARAYKRIQIILSLLHGETPDDVNFS